MVQGLDGWEMTCEVLAALISWAVHFSGYPQPTVQPTVQYKAHEFFKREACDGYPCDVLGWYRDDGVIYMDDRFKDRDDSFAASLMVHELVHFLQHQSGKFSRRSCADNMDREKEAYRVQNDYLVSVGNPALVFHLPPGCPPGA